MRRAGGGATHSHRDGFSQPALLETQQAGHCSSHSPRLPGAFHVAGPPASSLGQCEGQGQDVKPQVVRTPACPCFNPKWISASQYLHTVKK